MNGRYPEFDRDSCIACKACAKACPHSAVRFVGEEVTAPAIMDIVMRDKEYYEASDGGITFSGGEAFVQFDGLMELLALSKKQGLHTVVETSGQIDPGRIRKAFPFIDLFLFDIKHVEQQLLKRETNADLSTVLANMQYIAHQNPDKIILRVPVVPGYNFDRETIRKVFDLAKENNIGRVHLLPYHILGKDKYEQLGVSYNYPYESMLPKEELLPLKETGEKMGLQVCIGG
jgi:pyruvate formate lyase activating enzyme